VDRVGPVEERFGTGTQRVLIPIPRAFATDRVAGSHRSRPTASDSQRNFLELVSLGREDSASGRNASSDSTETSSSGRNDPSLGRDRASPRGWHASAGRSPPVPVAVCLRDARCGRAESAAARDREPEPPRGARAPDLGPNRVHARSLASWSSSSSRRRARIAFGSTCAKISRIVVLGPSGPQLQPRSRYS